MVFHSPIMDYVATFAKFIHIKLSFTGICEATVYLTSVQLITITGNFIFYNLTEIWGNEETICEVTKSQASVL